MALRVLLCASLVLASLAAIPTGASSAAGCGAAGTPTTTVYLPNITKTLGGPTGWVTPFIVQNVGTAPTTLEVSFYRFSDGALVTCRTVPGLPPGNSFADVPNDDEDLPGDTQFSVVVRSFGAPVVSVVNEHQGAGDRAEALSYVGLSEGATTIGLPYVAKFDSAYRTPAGVPYPWLTTFVIQNLGTGTASVRASFTSHDGTKSATLGRTIPPGRSQFVDPSSEAAIPADTEYAVLLESSEPIAVVANAHHDAPTAPAPMGFSYNGQAPSSSPSYLPWVARSAEGRTTSIYVQNTGDADAIPMLTFRHIGSTSEAVVEAPEPLPPGGTFTYAVPAAPTGSCPSSGSTACPRAGEHSLTVTGGSFAVLAHTRSSVTSLGITGGPTAGSRMYLPNLTRTLGGPGGWTTPIVVQSGGATVATLRWYRFADGALVATQYLPGLSPGSSLKVDPRVVPPLADDTQYAVVLDGDGPVRAVVLELSQSGGDGAMAYEGFAAAGPLTPAPALTSLELSPTTAGTSFGATVRFEVTARDQSGEPMIGVPTTWSVDPATLGTIDQQGLFTAGDAEGTGTVTVTTGSLSATATVSVAAETVALGGFTFTIRAGAMADLYVESSIAAADGQTLATTLDADVVHLTRTYGRSFTSRPRAYAFPTTATYTTGLQTVLGMTAQEAATIGSHADGVYRISETFEGVALNWESVQEEAPITVPRHELAHMMIQQISQGTSDRSLPAWFNEGSARLEELTIAGTEHRRLQNRYTAASMVATRTQFAVEDLIDQDAWNERSGERGAHQYYQASQLVQLIHDDVGQAGAILMMELFGAGEPFETAFEAVTGTALVAFEATAASRLQAISDFYPYVATARDEPGGRPGLSMILYGFMPDSTVTVDIVGLRTGFENTVKRRTISAYGAEVSFLGATWPADTYRITVTGPTGPGSIEPGKTVTVSVEGVKASSLGFAATLTH